MKLPKKLSRTTIYESKWINLYTDKVEMPSGRVIEAYHVLDYPTAAAVIIVINSKKEICFIKSLRYSTQQVEWELPAGGIDKGETAVEAAQREFYEETGYTCKNLKEVYAYNPSNGMSNQMIHIVYGELEEIKVQQDFDTDEVASIHWLTVEEIKQLIKSKAFCDGISLTAFLYYLAGFE